jgi:hypothetical protein
MSDTCVDPGSDSDSDSDSDADCEGGWTDPSTGYTWEDPPNGGTVTWTQAGNYCDSLGGAWQLPNVDELRTIVAGCTASETGGACPVHDGSSSADGGEICWGCSADNGPDEEGCYWDPPLHGTCGSPSSYWTSSDDTGNTAYAWRIAFRIAEISTDSKGHDYLVRCVCIDD